MPRYATPSSPKGPRRRSGAGSLGRRGTDMHLPSAQRRRTRKRGAQYLHHSQGFGRPGASARGGRPRISSSSRFPYAVIAVGCAFLVFLASVLWYANRSVQVELNGSTVSVRINSSVAQLIEGQDLGLKAGNLLAVDDSVLKKEGGDPYAIKLDGKELAASKAASTELRGGEKLTVGNGKDTYEKHAVKATTLQPALTVEGTGPISYVKTWGVPGRQEVWTGEQSGKTKDRGVVKKTVDCVVAARGVNPDDAKKKYAAITFDEGPGSHTAEILQVLAEKGVKATFFLQGETIEASDANRALVKSIAQGGHEIGTNAYGDTDLSKLSGDALRSELTRGFSAIKDNGGGQTALLRAPFSSFSAANWAQTMDIVGCVVGWSIDSGDWTLPGAQTVVDTVTGSVSNGDIILLTDNDSASEQAAQALPGIIDGLKNAGYELVTVSDLIKTDGELAEQVSTAKVKMPKDAVLPQASDAKSEQESS